jgi:hypothetical protein
MSPSSVRQYSALGDSGHMRIVEAVLSAQGRKVANGSHRCPARIDESVVCLDELPLPHAIRVGPPLVGFQLALAFEKPVHAREVQAVAAAEVMQIGYRYSDAVRVPESFPSKPGANSAACGVQVDVEANVPVSAPGLLNPPLFRS